MSAEIPVPSIVRERVVVPNEVPLVEPDSYRIALIGEAPGEKEEEFRRPFIGPSGDILSKALHSAGIDRTKCFIGNVCQIRPPHNHLTAFAWDGPEISSGLAKLTEDLTSFDPNICVLLGNTPLRVAKGKGRKISSWRGSLFLSDFAGPLYLRKCVPALHPADVITSTLSDGLIARATRSRRGSSQQVL